MTDEYDDDEEGVDDRDQGMIRAEDRGPLQPPPDAARMPLADRVTATCSLVYHQHGEQPTAADVRFSGILNTDGQEYSDRQCYHRQLLVGPQLMKLDTGWIARPGIVFMHNRGAGDYPLQPTKAQQERDKGLLVETWWSKGEGEVPGPIIRPGRFSFFELPPGVTVRLVCPKGQARLALWIIPE